MSNDTQNPKSTVAAVPTDSTPEEKRPNILVRGYRKIKNTPPRTALAVGLGVTLVAGGAFLGRKTAPLHVEIVEDDFVPEPLVSLESDDSTVA